MRKFLNAACLIPSVGYLYVLSLYYTSLVFVLRRFRDTVLASGGARHPHDVFQDFRGRPPSSHALFKSYGFA